MDKPMTQVEMLRWWGRYYLDRYERTLSVSRDLFWAAETIELQARDIEQLQGEVRDLNMRLEKQEA
jgi:hypothetical protein